MYLRHIKSILIGLSLIVGSMSSLLVATIIINGLALNTVFVVIAMVVGSVGVILSISGIRSLANELRPRVTEFT